MDAHGVLKTVLAQTSGSRYVFLPAYRFHGCPVSPMVQPVSNLTEVVGCLEVVRPATNDRRSTSKADRDAFLHWAIAKDLAQRTEIRDFFTAGSSGRAGTYAINLIFNGFSAFCITMAILEFLGRGTQP